jgi:hypothetical protein
MAISVTAMHGVMFILSPMGGMLYHGPIKVQSNGRPGIRDVFAAL